MFLRAGLIAVIVLTVGIRSAEACSTSACSVPAITALGQETVYQNRLRLWSAVRGWGMDEPGSDGGMRTIREARSDLGLSYAPLPWLLTTLVIPLQLRSFMDVNAARSTSLGIGDMELSARALLWKDRVVIPRHVLSVIAGTKAPTSPLGRSRNGQAFDLDAQLGSGTWDPFAGLSYLGVSGPWVGMISGTVRVPLTVGFDEHRAGFSINAVGSLQYQFVPWFAAQLGMEGRYLAPGRTRGVLDDVGSGTAFFVGPDALFRVTPRWMIQAGARAPVAQALRGNVRMLPVFTASVAYDL